MSDTEITTVTDASVAPPATDAVPSTMRADAAETDLPTVDAAPAEAAPGESNETLPVEPSPVDVFPIEETVAAVEVELPGKTLREARECLRLTVAEVAQTLKFSVRQIEALESDDYGNLPGTTFLRGFVRSYAKLLKIDAETLLAMLDSRAPAVLPDVRAPQNMGEATTSLAGARRSSSPFVIGAVVLLIAAAGLGAWHFLAGKSELASTLPRAANGNGAPAVAVAPVVQAASADVVPIQPPQLRIEPTPAAPTEATAAVPMLPPNGRQLVFVFEERSWLEVKDAAQRILVTGVFPAGDRQSAVGKPPFNIWIGKASSVRVFDGETQLDLKPHTRDDVARLTVQ